MNTNWKRTLTETVLGECWHEVLEDDISCWKCGKGMFACEQRTFLTWQDLGDVKDALVKMGKWDKFYYFALVKHELETVSQVKEAPFATWLFRPLNDKGQPHFCKLVSEWWEGQKK